MTYSRKVFIPLTRLCRDRCHYCTFATVPQPASRRRTSRRTRSSRSPGRARRWAARRRCSPSGDRPEDRWPEAREWLDAHGYDVTLAYVRAMAIRVLEETGLLPHLNPGVMTWADLQRLKPVAPSMGMMLETTSTRLFTEPGQAHFGSPTRTRRCGCASSRTPAGVRCPVHHRHPRRHRRDAAERVDSILAIRASRGEYGSVQEVHRPELPGQGGHGDARTPDLGEEEYLATIAVTRLLLGPSVTVQAPPNLSDPQQISACSRPASTTGAASPR